MCNVSIFGQEATLCFFSADLTVTSMLLTHSKAVKLKHARFDCSHLKNEVQLKMHACSFKIVLTNTD